MSVLRRANPRTRAGIRILHAMARVVANPVVQGGMRVVGKRLVRVSADDLQLPDYSVAARMGRDEPSVAGAGE
jgi:hypothetical protein